ncbi:16S rRNA (uracil(1498)-N(3))-methyltransferase [Flocculibacter collagenilyticus]|uniref:16S rRNA (uracil(1498)-N(3))-methyltransferase n=1 Tax=Flocculibacter collagenilyticus TaxID=2744479 RepID=UPI0018F484D6|nr:16S rRNA (uracil(1498)-N(3))-methyltransferase [Flocculibacter collagenilyticus]
MRAPRIFHPEAIQLNQPTTLTDDAVGHVGRVLRMNVGDHIRLFHNANTFSESGEFLSEIVEVSKKKVVVKPIEFIANDVESPLTIHLGQGISRGDKMELTIQKSVELGVTEITPLFSERCGVKLSGERLEKKLSQWQKIAISACEQCGRNAIPVIHPPMQFNEWVSKNTNELKLNLHPRAKDTIKTIGMPNHGVRFLVGPEGGLSESEIDLASAQGFKEILIGPRVLRTETAALTVITALQVQYGDLA